jgi:hypothetical protein
VRGRSIVDLTSVTSLWFSLAEDLCRPLRDWFHCLSLTQGLRLFDFALSEIPTSRAKNAREMGHPDSLPEIASDARFSLAGKDQSNWKKLQGSVF